MSVRGIAAQIFTDERAQLFVKHLIFLGYYRNEGCSVRQHRTPSALLVKISKLPDRVSQVQIMNKKQLFAQLNMHNAIS